jgi:hypothetical protein
MLTFYELDQKLHEEQAAQAKKEQGQGPGVLGTLWQGAKRVVGDTAQNLATSWKQGQQQIQNMQQGNQNAIDQRTAQVQGQAQQQGQPQQPQGQQPQQGQPQQPGQQQGLPPDKAAEVQKNSANSTGTYEAASGVAVLAQASQT